LPLSLVSLLELYVRWRPSGALLTALFPDALEGAKGREVRIRFVGAFGVFVFDFDDVAYDEVEDVDATRLPLNGSNSSLFCSSNCEENIV
jgi:hypothetical protein